MTEFLGVAEKATKLLHQFEADPSLAIRLADLRLYANRQTLKRLGSLPPGLRARLIEPTDEEQEFFESKLIDWADGGIEQWLALMSGEGDFVRHYVDILSAIRRRFPFDVIVHWGENGAVNLFCEAFGIPHVAMEFGCTRPPYMDSIVFDPFGVNGASAPAKVSFDDIEAITGGAQNSKFVDLIVYGNTLDSLAYEESFGYHSFDDADVLLGKAGQKVAYLPLQLYDDSNLLRFSPFNTVQDVVEAVVPKAVEGGYLCIVKPHPSSRLRQGSLQANEQARRALRQYGASVVWIDPDKNNVPNARLFSLADCVITVNSSVGFEALLHGKAVSVLGEAMYKPSGVFPSLDDILTEKFDRAEYLRRIAVLRKFFLNGYLAPVNEVSEIPTFVERVVGTMVAQAEVKNEPAGVIRTIYQKFAASQELRRMTAARSGIRPPEPKTPGVSAGVPAVIRRPLPAPVIRLIRQLLTPFPSALRYAQLVYAKWNLRHAGTRHAKPAASTCFQKSASRDSKDG